MVFQHRKYAIEIVGVHFSYSLPNFATAEAVLYLYWKLFSIVLYSVMCWSDLHHYFALLVVLFVYLMN